MPIIPLHFPSLTTGTYQRFTRYIPFSSLLIAATFIYEALQKKKAKEARISRKASARADLKAKRSK